MTPKLSAIGQSDALPSDFQLGNRAEHYSLDPPDLDLTG